MIKHVVMWRVSGTSEEERREHAERMRHALEGLRGKVPGMSSLEVGLGAGGDEQLADVCLISTHDDLEALKAYQVHPAHVEAVRVIAEVRIERRVVDFEVAEPARGSAIPLP